MNNIKQEKKRDQEKKLDKELKDTFPASDPPSGNVFVGAPKERQANDEDCECDKKKSSK